MSGQSIRPSKNYGDETALRRLNPQATKEANGEQPIARRDAGRPAGPAYRGAPGIAPAEAEAESPYTSYYRAFGQAARRVQIADAMVADPMAGPWENEYKLRAYDDATRAGTAVRENTPYTEE